MNDFRADLHIHSVLSPCGDLEMSPRNIIRRAGEMKIDIIGISDHNSTKHGPLMRRLGNEVGVFVMTGAEVTTREEVHCLVFFENDDRLGSFQEYLDANIIRFPNEPHRFGHQVVVDGNDNILEEVENLLIYSIDQSIDQLEKVVHKLDGLFIPAHINRPFAGLISQLGFVPAGIKADALELFRSTDRDEFLSRNPYLSHYTFIQSSDAHFPEDIGRSYSVFRMEETSFQEVRMALAKEEGRRVIKP